MTRLPGLSSKLPERVDQLGRPVVREGGVAGQFLDPTNARTDRTETDPTIRELARVGAAITRLKREKGEGGHAYAKRAKLYGRVLEMGLQATMASEEYRAIPSIAQALVKNDPRFSGRDAALLARELQKNELEAAARTVRAQLTRLRKAG